MKCTLMHKRQPVVHLDLDDETGFIQNIDAVFSVDHLPLGVMSKQIGVDRSALNSWWTDRSIPASRSEVREALETLKKKHANASRLLLWP